jgi:hypothetical protein
MMKEEMKYQLTLTNEKGEVIQKWDVSEASVGIAFGQHGESELIGLPPFRVAMIIEDVLDMQDALEIEQSAIEIEPEEARLSIEWQSK